MRRSLISLSLLLLLLATTPILAAVPNLISYQGRLSGPGGIPLSGEYDLTFQLYPDSVGGVSFFSETQTVTITNGLFSVLLGSVTPMIDDISVYLSFYGGGYLSIQVNAGPELQPRRRLAGAPFALGVGSLWGAQGGSITSPIEVNIPTTIGSYAIGGIGNLSGGYFEAHKASESTAGVIGKYQGPISDAAGVYGYSSPAFGHGIGGKFYGGYCGVLATTTSIASSNLPQTGVIASATGVGSVDGNNIGVYGVAGGALTNTGVAGFAYHNGVPGAYAYGVYGSAQFIDGYGAWAGYFNGWTTCKGTLEVQGTLTKTAGSFRIDHPLDPEHKYLQHSFVESPDMMNIYNGNVVTDAQGEATIEMPDWFSALNRDFRYQLTVIGEFAQAIVGKKMNANHFTIRTDKPNVEVSWQVTGIRQDAYANAHRIAVEVDKKPQEVGLYIDPQSFGLGPERQLHYKMNKAADDARIADEARVKANAALEPSAGSLPVPAGIKSK